MGRMWVVALACVAATACGKDPKVEAQERAAAEARVRAEAEAAAEKRVRAEVERVRAEMESEQAAKAKAAAESDAAAKLSIASAPEKFLTVTAIDTRDTKSPCDLKVRFLNSLTIKNSASKAVRDIKVRIEWFEFEEARREVHFGGRFSEFQLVGRLGPGDSEAFSVAAGNLHDGMRVPPNGERDVVMKQFKVVGATVVE